MLDAFLLCFIPLLVAIDPLGMAPVFLSVTSGFDTAQRRRLVAHALPTAAAIGVSFFLLGPTLLGYLGVAITDMQIAGGGLLFIFAMLDLFIPGKPSVQESQSLGIVPLATPLIVGPAVLTLGPVLVRQHGPVMAVSALLVNLALLAVTLWFVDAMTRIIPINAMRAISKVIDLLLAAIGVMMVRTGIEALAGA